MLPSVLACSMCGDMIFRARYWWAPAATLILGGLLLEAVVFAIIGVKRRRPTRAPRAIVVIPSLAIPVLTTFIGLGTIIGIWVVLALAFVMTLGSLVANRADGALVGALRVGLVLAGVLTALLLASPSRRETHELVRIGAYVNRFKISDGWLYDELRRRPDAAAGLTALFQDVENYQCEGALQVHARLGFPASDRAETCRKLQASKAWHEQLVGACGARP